MSGKPMVLSYGHGTESKTFYSTNHSTHNHCSTNQNAGTWHGHHTALSPHSMNCTVTTSHSYENDSITGIYHFTLLCDHSRWKLQVFNRLECCVESIATHHYHLGWSNRIVIGDNKKAIILHWLYIQKQQFVPFDGFEKWK